MRPEAAYTPHYSELIAAERAAIAYQFPSIKRHTNRVHFAIYFVVVFILSVVSPTLFEMLSPQFGPRRSVSLMVLCVVGTLLLAELLARKFSEWWAIRALNRQKQLQPVTVSLSAERISWTSADRGTWIDWTGIDRALRLPSLLILIAGGLAYVVPTRVFASEDEVNAFVDAVWEHLTDEARASSHKHPSLQTVR